MGSCRCQTNASSTTTSLQATATHGKGQPEPVRLGEGGVEDLDTRSSSRQLGEEDWIDREGVPRRAPGHGRAVLFEPRLVARETVPDQRGSASSSATRRRRPLVGGRSQQMHQDPLATLLVPAGLAKPRHVADHVEVHFAPGLDVELPADLDGDGDLTRARKRGGPLPSVPPSARRAGPRASHAISPPWHRCAGGVGWTREDPPLRHHVKGTPPRSRCSTTNPPMWQAARRRRPPRRCKAGGGRRSAGRRRPTAAHPCPPGW